MLAVECVEVEAVDVLRLGVAGFVAKVFARLAFSLNLPVVLSLVL